MIYAHDKGKNEIPLSDKEVLLSLGVTPEEYSGEESGANMKYAVANSTNFKNWKYEAKYIPALKMSFFRGYATAAKQLTANEAHTIFTLADLAKIPSKHFALSAYYGGNACVEARVTSDGEITVKFTESISGSYAIYISGFWFDE